MQKVFTSRPKYFQRVTYSILSLLLLGTTILYLSSYKWITVFADGKTLSHVTKAKGVGEVLEEIGLELRAEDYVFPSREAKLQRLTSIAVVKAKPYSIVHDGARTEIWATGEKVADVLLAAGIPWQEQDLIEPAPERAAGQVEVITLIRVSSAFSYEMVTLPYAVTRVANDSLYRGQERLVQAGRDGKKIEVTQIVYHDQRAVGENIVSSRLLLAPQDEIRESGTITSINRGGLKISISRALEVQSTAYCSGVKGSGCPVDERGYSQCTGKATGFTSTGRQAKQGAGTRTNPYLIAVDPRVIPLGTLCYLSFQGGVVVTRHGRIIKDGFALAADTGGAIKGERIDILFDNHWVAWYYGRRTVKVFIVESIIAE